MPPETFATALRSAAPSLNELESRGLSREQANDFIKSFACIKGDRPLVGAPWIHSAPLDIPLANLELLAVFFSIELAPLRPTSRQLAASCRQTTQVSRLTHPVSRPQFKQGKIKVPDFIERSPLLAGRGKVRLDSPHGFPGERGGAIRLFNLTNHLASTPENNWQSVQKAQVNDLLHLQKC
ncbi:MAG TPA: hypothetical protein VGX70_13660, partial [Gemmataceae bacterium]|nr:hypothetical protein [Gemmataceae bacterium]